MMSNAWRMRDRADCVGKYRGQEFEKICHHQNFVTGKIARIWASEGSDDCCSAQTFEPSDKYLECQPAVFTDQEAAFIT